MGVPENIDALLIKFDITQEELGNAVGLTQSAVSGWRRGKTPLKQFIKRIEYTNINGEIKLHIKLK